jgi:hypothetical protein
MDIDIKNGMKPQLKGTLYRNAIGSNCRGLGLLYSSSISLDIIGIVNIYKETDNFAAINGVDIFANNSIIKFDTT